MQTTFTGSGNQGLQIGQNPGTVNVNFTGATDMGRLSFLFHLPFIYTNMLVYDR